MYLTPHSSRPLVDTARHSLPRRRIKTLLGARDKSVTNPLQTITLLLRLVRPLPYLCILRNLPRKKEVGGQEVRTQVCEDPIAIGRQGTEISSLQ